MLVVETSWPYSSRLSRVAAVAVFARVDIKNLHTFPWTPGGGRFNTVPSNRYS